MLFYDVLKYVTRSAMQKHRIVIGLIVCGIFLLSSLSIGGFCRSLMLPAVRELPKHEIRRKFEVVTGYKLPRFAGNVRAIFWDSRDPAIFVTFTTDAEGIAYMRRTFGGPSVKQQILSNEQLRAWALSGWQPFVPLSDAEEKLGISLFQLESLTSALWLQQEPQFDVQPGYDILIDLEGNVVYMKVLRI